MDVTKRMAKIELIATAPMGLEAIVAREIKDLGYDEMTVENGRVTFLADEMAICRANLWLRTADRVLVKMGEFKASTFEELFEGTKALPWPDWIPENATFPVEGKSQKSTLTSVPACQGIVKKAIVEKMKQKYRTDWFDETGPRYTIEVALLKDVATLTLDTSGIGLHKRGYRKLTAAAPIKETLAAAMVLLTRWNAERPLVDPFCGSGTIPIEAGLIGRNIAPGLKRSFAAEEWPIIPQRLWDTARKEAKDLAKRDEPLDLFGSDIDSEVLSLAKYHAQEAGLGEDIEFRRSPVSNLKSVMRYGVIISNPPYGERIGERAEVEQAYRDLGKASAPLDTWSVFVLTSHPGFEKLFGRQAGKKRKLYNGRIECNFYQYLGPLPPRAKRD